MNKSCPTEESKTAAKQCIEKVFSDKKASKNDGQRKAQHQAVCQARQTCFNKYFKNKNIFFCLIQSKNPKK